MRELMRRELAGDHGACGLEAAHRLGIAVGHTAQAGLRAPGGQYAFGVVDVLQCDGHPVQWTPAVPGHDLGVSLSRRREGTLGHERHMGIESCVEGCDTCECRLDQLERRQLPGRNHACGVRQRQVRKIDHLFVPPRTASCRPAIVHASIRQGETSELRRGTVRDIAAFLGAIGVFLCTIRSRAGDRSAVESTGSPPSRSVGRNVFDDSGARYQRSNRQRVTRWVPVVHGLNPLSTRIAQCVEAVTSQSVIRALGHRHGSNWREDTRIVKEPGRIRIPRSIIFDFDYTLADSSAGIIECVNHALRGLSLRTSSEDAIRHTIGMSLPRALVALTDEDHADLADEFQRLFMERADEVIHNATRLFEFVPSLLDSLSRHGITLGIVSTKFRRRIEAVLQRDNLTGRFAVIVGGEDVEALKPDPTGLLRATAQLDDNVERCLSVGDSVTDGETAQRAGVPFAAVLSGVTERNAFARYEPVMILDCAGDLPGALELSP